jgi:iron complex outermembrane receptor protein
MRWWVGTAFTALSISVSSVAFAGDPATSPPGNEDLSNLSIEQLAQIQVRSVSKREEPLSEAPAALYVIDHDQIIRSGATTIPEMLRLAPNLQVYQQTPAHWVVTARGLNGLPFAQSFSNKLLVLVDGRTVYTPLFSGVYWDLPDLLPDDIERIEVISGPGATLWGANAVNGVINIITRSASSTSGAYVDVEGGGIQQVAGVRLAGQAGKSLAYRVYGRWLRQDAAHLANGGTAGDGWHRLGGGFRLDWNSGGPDTVTFQGDIFGGREDELTGTHEDISGHDLVVRWNRDTGRGQGLQLQAFYDRMARGETSSSGSFHVDTYDVDLQHSIQAGPNHQLVWGAGARIAHYRINGSPSFFFDPSGRDLFLANIFVQDTFSLSKQLSVTAGLKAEDDPYVGFSLLPNVRLAFKPTGSTLLWAAISHAVRSPTPFDEDVQESVPGVSLIGNRDFRTEKLTAYELGLRAQPLAALSFSVTGFYHQYDDLRSVELVPGPGLSLQWANNLAGHSYGVEAWANASPLPWWTLSAGAMLLKEDFHFKPAATATFIGTSQNGVDPGHQFTLRSSMDLGRSVMLDLDLRAVGRLIGDVVPAYTELGGRLAWNMSDHLTLSLSGSNLLHDHHVEYPGGDAISRKVLVGLQWRR